MRIDRIHARATWPLRQLVLRPGLPLEACAFPHDEEADSFHLGAWADDALVGIASIYAEACAALPAAKPFRLRGMAVHPDRRGLGVGALLVVEALNAVRTADGDLLWCNARTSASGFYTRLGFAVVGEAFELPGIGPHHLMHRAP
ncbi:MAG: GNAT family N-acetyltransferase [Flavobacteriales bacterium]|nr:GNAT family N-acetyltransferase [Flavobacteriales bacterium]